VPTNISCGHRWGCRTSTPLPPTRPHLNSVGPGVEVGGPQTLGGRGVGGATATAIIVVVVILLLARLLWLLLLAPEFPARFPPGIDRLAPSGTMGGLRVREDGMEVFEVLVQPAQDVQHENAVGDVNTEVGE
jgi:hypothetical protein